MTALAGSDRGRLDEGEETYAHAGGGRSDGGVAGVALPCAPAGALRRLRARQRPVGRHILVTKRAIDIAAALIGLLLTAPVFAYVAWRIKRESPGPIFYRQRRLGAQMREFEILKFRTMSVDADDATHREYIRQMMRGSDAARNNGLYKLARTECITPFGAWLRRTSLDELPQLINVLRGEMSLVGPRPCLAYETEHFEPHHFERFLMPAGMTGLWQVTLRARATFRDALELDVIYVRTYSLGLDFRILWQTPRQVLRLTTTA